MGGNKDHDLMSDREVRQAMCVREENHAAFRQTLPVSSVPRAYLGSRLGVQPLPVGGTAKGASLSSTGVPF